MAGTYLLRTLTSTGNRKLWTWSAWIKKAIPDGTEMGLFGLYEDGANYFRIRYKPDQRLSIDNVEGNTTTMSLILGIDHRDVSGWYHLVVRYDSAQSTDSNRVKIYVNGVLQTEFQAATYPSQNANTYFPVNALPLNVGRTTNNKYFDGSMSHIHFTDGYAYDASTFGSTDATTGQWKINTSPSVTYGTNGFFIFKDNGAKTDQSGNSNNFSEEGTPGIVSNTQDCPSNVFATWNPLQATTAATYAFEAGNTRMSVNDAAVFSLGATLAATTGKYYMEMKWVQQGGNGSWGMIPIDTDINNRPRNAGVGWNQGDNAPWLLGSIVSGSWGGSIGTNDIIQLAMDLDNGAFYFGKNDVWLNSGNPTSGSSKTGAVDFSGTSLFGEQLTFAIGKGASGTDGWNANFGNGYFEQTAVADNSTATASTPGVFNYAVPTGYQPLSTKGLNA